VGAALVPNARADRTAQHPFDAVTTNQATDFDRRTADVDGRTADHGRDHPLDARP
jgi:hypothetical protein